MSSADRQAWGDFWQTRGGERGCLPDALRAIDAVQRQCWEEFAQKLPKRARLLDLATGNGVVLTRIAGVRPDLKLVGVDAAESLPAAPAGIALKTSVKMEALPFPDGSFGAVTSQFGIEYGDAAAAAAEVGRVLSRGGRLRAIVHHADGPIVAHNRARTEALRWAVRESGYLERARTFAAARRMGPIPTPQSFRDAPAEARRLFPRQPVAAEFVTAILQTLDFSRHGSPDETIEVLGTLESRADNEMARVASLERAACDEAKIGGLSAALEDSGVSIEEPSLLYEAGAKQPFAWLLSGEKR